MYTARRKKKFRARARDCPCSATAANGCRCFGGVAHIIYPDKRAKRCVTEVISSLRETSFKTCARATATAASLLHGIKEHPFSNKKEEKERERRKNILHVHKGPSCRYKKKVDEEEEEEE